jgi:hypothetical protein
MAKKPAKTVWKGAKELESILLPIGDLIPDPNNENPHTPEEIKRATIVLAEHGQMSSVTYWIDADGKKILKKGHKIHGAAEILGWSHLAAVQYAGDEQSAAMYRIADNKLGQDSKLDFASVGNTILALQESIGEGFDPALMAFDEHETDNALKELAKQQAEMPKTDDDDSGESGGGGGGEETNISTTIAYNLVFEDEHQQKIFFDFLRSLKDRYPDDETVAARVIHFISDAISGSDTQAGFTPGGFTFAFATAQEKTQLATFLQKIHHRYEGQGGEGPHGDLLRFFTFLSEVTE